MDLTFLGRGSAFNTVERNNNAFFKENGNLFLIDCGESAFSTLKEKNILNDVNSCFVVITHTHGDHFGSLSSLALFFFFSKKKKKILELSKEIENGNEIISKEQNIIKAQIVWAVKKEMAINIEDFLSRRTRLLLLNQKEAVRIAPIVAEVMAKELGKDEVWQKNEIESFKNIAEIYHTHI